MNNYTLLYVYVGRLQQIMHTSMHMLTQQKSIWNTTRCRRAGAQIAKRAMFFMDRINKDLADMIIKSLVLPLTK